MPISRQKGRLSQDVNPETIKAVIFGQQRQERATFLITLNMAPAVNKQRVQIKHVQVVKQVPLTFSCATTTISFQGSKFKRHI